MSQQESNYIPFTSNQELANPMDLLLNKEWLRFYNLHYYKFI
ncbi:MAG: hypothetical protein ACKPEO_20480 [Sphaerospermopsis kisseleviana]|uniref:Uncharacterized protein n=1 Tax=Sphaerospermopsis kisseleviana CS-549 TaxID=3021783 RepID=A0ABT4ZP07_9CYAN|nr:hypothetical protein [Sphaerospermopsis kisseleviana]MDB9441141.1 hypothetical protein [Sphaerospermopsis kisseleviana CS-549]